jgi:spermidine synthase
MMKSELWVEERFLPFYGMKFKVNKVLFSGQSDFQSVEVVETEGHGRMLLNDGLVMVSERDERVYHEMMAHVPLLVHTDPKNVLIIGGGDGGTAREVLRHPNVKNCTMVEIDKMVVDACREFIPQTASKLNDPRMKLIFADGVKFLKETKEKFDVILIDSSDPIGPAAPLFGKEFYQTVWSALSDQGIVVSQAESPWYMGDMQLKIAEFLSSMFPVLRFYNFANLTYPGSLWSFSFASKKFHPLRDFKEGNRPGLEKMFYYNEEMHRAAFALPQYQKEELRPFLKD